MQRQLDSDSCDNMITISLKLFKMHDNMAELSHNSTSKIMNSVLDGGIIINNKLMVS